MSRLRSSDFLVGVLAGFVVLKLGSGVGCAFKTFFEGVNPTTQGTSKFRESPRAKKEHDNKHNNQVAEAET
jgi:hypothetical protein